MLSLVVRVLPFGRLVGLIVALGCALPVLADNKTEADNAGEDQLEDLTDLPAFNVKADRLEEFGFRVGVMFAIPGPSYAWVKEVFPNTAASKAGLRPGDIILKVDGKKRSLVSLYRLLKAQDKKWAELAAGKKSVSWIFDVRDPVTKETRTVTMIVPSPAPHWGSAKWSPPEGRVAAVINEPGPLAGVAGEILDNGIWTKWDSVAFLGVPKQQKNVPVLGYEWRIVEPAGTHRMWVTQQHGKTEIILECRLPETGTVVFLTTPAGTLENTRYSPPKKNKKLKRSPEELTAAFQTEVDFWLTKVGRVSGRWPFEALSVAGGTGDIAIVRRDIQGPVVVATALPAAFLALPVADETQRALFADALGKVGADQESWAYTETSNGFGDDRVTTARIDPSKPEAERSTLLLVDGKKPKAEIVQQWRDDARGMPEPLGELPSISSLVDLNDVRVFADEATSIVFELPVKSTSAEFPADKVQALFRVNKTQCAFESFSVALRESIRVAGVAKVTEAGLEVRFQSFDPALAPSRSCSRRAARRVCCL
ncbi:MAG: PDZ domain-containing protein [Nibricoccus sp.]